MIHPDDLRAFVTESNRIEGIIREPTDAEISATAAFLALPEITVADAERLVEVYAPGKRLRTKAGMNVRVGRHYPPPGGPEIKKSLAALLERVNAGDDPWECHVSFETTHPFLDGNGRSGRAIWCWQMHRQGRDPFRLGFLHAAYYQALDHAGRLMGGR